VVLATTTALRAMIFLLAVCATGIVVVKTIWKKPTPPKENLEHTVELPDLSELLHDTTELPDLIGMFDDEEDKT